MPRRQFKRREASEILCKIRGITLNYNTLQLVNFEVIKDMVFERTVMGHVTTHREENQT